MNARTLISSLLCAVALAVSTVSAAPQTRAELKPRFEQRFPRLDKLKAAGEIGETWEGYVAALDDRLLDQDATALVAAENADRKKLYQLIADEVVEDEGGKKKHVPAEEVAQENAKRNIERARPKDYFWVKEGRWVRKQDESRYAKLVKLKKDGKVGETWDGSIEAVDAAEVETKAIIASENAARKEMYESLAKKLNTAAEKVAQEAAKDIESHLQAGRMFKDKTGKWRKQAG